MAPAGAIALKKLAECERKARSIDGHLDVELGRFAVDAADDGVNAVAVAFVVSIGVGAIGLQIGMTVDVANQ